MHPLSGHTILFLPGMDGTGISFEPLGKILPRDVEVKIIQYPTDRLLNFNETVEWAKGRIPSGSKETIVIAESFSGPVAIALIGSGQLKAKCLILCATFARSPRPLLFSLFSCLPLMLLLKIPFPKFIFRLAIKGEDEAVDQFIALWRKIKVLVPAKVLAHRLRVINRIDVCMWLPKLAIPCCYIQATSDRSVPASSLTDFTEAVSDLSVKKIKGPHFILQARPRVSLSAIQDFVASLGTPSNKTRFGSIR